MLLIPKDAHCHRTEAAYVCKKAKPLLIVIVVMLIASITISHHGVVDARVRCKKSSLHLSIQHQELLVRVGHRDGLFVIFGIRAGLLGTKEERVDQRAAGVLRIKVPRRQDGLFQGKGVGIVALVGVVSL